MKYEEYLELPLHDKLEKFMSSRSLTNRTAKYYVNWGKVRENVKKYEIELNTLNYLLGKANIKQEATMLFTKQPQLLKAVPTLIAARDYNLNVLMITEEKTLSFYNLNFTDIDESRIEDYVNFIEDTGLLDFMQNDANKSLVDYAYGIEAGLDSNGRKNRSGTQNEQILENNLEYLVKNSDLEFATQIGHQEIKSRWGIDVKTDKSSRRFDGAVFNPNTQKVTLIETNFYGGGGSKLKAVSGEFRDLNRFVSDEHVQFVWISDGMGWDTAKLPLTEAFEQIPNIINLAMVNDGYLLDIVNS